MFTELETQVYNAAVEICSVDYSASVKRLSKLTGLSMETIKGVVGSLVKKHRMLTESRDVDLHTIGDIFPMNEKGECLNFGDWS